MSNEKITFSHPNKPSEVVSSSGFKVEVIDRDLVKYTRGDRSLVFPFDAVKIKGESHHTYYLPQDKMLWEVPYHNEPITDDWIGKIKLDLTELTKLYEQRSNKKITLHFE
jgi:hypothetical protein